MVPELQRDGFIVEGLGLNNVAIIDNFEYRIDEPQANARRLRLLEDVVYLRLGKPSAIVILSMLDLVDYLSPVHASRPQDDDDRDVFHRWVCIVTPFKFLSYRRQRFDWRFNDSLRRRRENRPERGGGGDELDEAESDLPASSPPC